MNAATNPERMALYFLRRSSNSCRSICANYARYEEWKRQWIAAHPNATATEYDIAMQRIARACGV